MKAITESIRIKAEAETLEKHQQKLLLITTKNALKAQLLLDSNEEIDKRKEELGRSYLLADEVDKLHDSDSKNKRRKRRKGRKFGVSVDSEEEDEDGNGGVEEEVEVDYEEMNRRLDEIQMNSSGNAHTSSSRQLNKVPASKVGEVDAGPLGVIRSVVPTRSPGGSTGKALDIAGTNGTTTTAAAGTLNDEAPDAGDDKVDAVDTVVEAAEEEIVYHCELCQKYFKSEPQLTQHLSNRVHKKKEQEEVKKRTKTNKSASSTGTTSNNSASEIKKETTTTATPAVPVSPSVSKAQYNSDSESGDDGE